MKEHLTPGKLSIVFWAVFVTTCLWLSISPLLEDTPPPPSITVKVEHPLPDQETRPVDIEVSTDAPPVFDDERPQALVAPSPLPKIAIVIDDMGVEIKKSERAINLPAAITLSFLPFSIRANEQAKTARDKGHEILLHLPMEPIGRENPGPGALLVDLPLAEIQKRLETALANITGYEGANNHMGSKFTTFEEGLNVVFDTLKERGLFFLDSRTSAQSIAQKVAQEKGLPFIGRDVFLDDDQSPEAIEKQLALTEQIARKKGFAVAIGHPHTTTLDALEKWVAEAPEKGFELVPLKSLVYKDTP